MQIIIPEENFTVFSINKEIQKVMFCKDENRLKNTENIELILPDSCVDAISVFYFLQDKDFITKISVPYNFGCCDFCSESDYQKEFLKANILLNNEDLQENLLQQLFVTLFLDTISLQEIIYKKDMETISGYPLYDNNFLRGSYFINFSKYLREIKFRENRNSKGKNGLVFEDGLIFSADKKILYRCLPSKSVEVLSLSEDIEVIADKAFYNCSEIKKIHIPDSVIYVGNNSFYCCNAQIE